jgi:H+/Cl- antiporter ClcA
MGTRPGAGVRWGWRVGLLAVGALLGALVGLVGARLASPSRAGVVGAAAGLLGVTTLLAAPAAAGGSLVVPGNTVGYAWLIGVMAVSAVIVSWPRVQRAPRQRAASMNESLNEKETVAP